MLGSWALVLVVLGGTWALPAPLTYPQALALAVDSYNQRPEVEKVFRMLSATPEPSPDVQVSSLQNLNFTLMETQCPARSAVPPDSCDFKDDGVIKECSAPVPQRGSSAVLDVTCVESTVDPVRVKRFWPLLTVAFSVFKAIKRK
ncbi:CTHL3 protein, partial [Centropus bengalensis]|nr:CTHL3 protein [Centropus bengalensis]